MSKKHHQRLKKFLRRPSLAPLPDEDGLRSNTSLPLLRFSPTAWAKLQMFCHAHDVEIGGFGVTPAADPLFVEEFVTVRQQVSLASVSFDDSAVAEFFDEQVDLGRKPENFARIWLHTHPGSCPEPSITDEKTFTQAFGRCDWAVMFILSRTGRTYARLRLGSGPRVQLPLAVQIQLDCPFAAADHDAWNAEYERNIWPERMLSAVAPPTVMSERLASVQGLLEPVFPSHSVESATGPDAHKLLMDLQRLDPLERRTFFDALEERPELWAEEGGWLHEWT